MQMITQGDTQTLIKANTCNKTGYLDIFSFRLSRRKPGFNSPWDYQIIRLWARPWKNCPGRLSEMSTAQSKTQND